MLQQRTHPGFMAKTAELIKNLLGMVAVEKSPNGNHVKERAPTRTVTVTSPFTTEQLPPDELCETCNLPMTPVTSSWRCTGDHVVVRAERVPAFQCAQSCHFEYYPPEVMSDLLAKAIPILVAAGDVQLADRLDRDLAQLEGQETPLLPAATSALQAA